MNGRVEDSFFIRVQGELHQISFLGIFGFCLLGEEMKAMGDAVNKISRGIAGVFHGKVG